MYLVKRNVVPFLLVSLASVVYVLLTLAIRTGNNPASKFRMLVLEHGLLLPVSLFIVLWSRRRSPDRPHAGRLRLWMAIAVYLVLTLPLAFAVRKGIYNADESAYLFESKAMLTGALAVKAPPQTAADPMTYQHDFFFEQHVIYDTKWFSKYPPGWPALLAAGLWTHAGWLLNPLLGLLTLLLTYVLARRIYDERVARVAAFLLSLSPFFVLNTVGYMSHPACAAAIAGSALLLWQGVETQRLRCLVGMFVLLGYAVLIRPYTAAVAGAVLVSILLWSTRRNPRLQLDAITIGLAITAVAAAGLLAHNRALTGSFFVSPYTLFQRIEYSPDASFRLANIISNARTMTPISIAKTALDAAPFVFLLAAAALVLERRFWPCVLGALSLAFVAGYLCMADASDSVVGERYYMEGYFAAVILAARGWMLICERLRVPAHAMGALAAGLVALQLFHYGLLAGTVLRLKTGYGRVVDAVAELHLDRAVALMKPAPGFGAKNFNPNAADWEREAVFFVLDPGPARRRQVVCALDRPQWVLVSYRQDRRAAVIEGRGDAACEETRLAASPKSVPAN